MKTLIPLTIASLALIASLNVFGEPLLSPRASGNAIKTTGTVDNSANTVIQNRNVIASPRTIDNRGTVAKGMDASPNTIAGGCALGSPKQLEQAGKFTSGDCCKVVSVRCSTPKSCCTVASK